MDKKKTETHAAVTINKTTLKIITADITTVHTDAIVNAANNQLIMGGGVAGVIKRNGGNQIQEEASKKSPIQIGEAVHTAAGKLPARFVIHAATMGMDFKTNEYAIRSACAQSLLLAKKLKLTSIAFPALGCGTGKFPAVAAAKIMAQEVLRHAKYEDTSLREVLFVLYSKETYEVFAKICIGYLEYIQHKLCQGPFVTVDIIIEVARGIVLIERSNPPFGWAIPGGFLDYGETLEHCAQREAKEETNLDVYDLEQMHTYSDPRRDPRFQTVTTVFTAKAQGTPRAGDDAQNVKVVALSDIARSQLAFDHTDVLQDYLQFRKKQELV